MQMTSGTGLARLTAGKLRLISLPRCRGQQTAAPKKIEVFINDKKVLVDPGTTIMQVCAAVFILSIISKEITIQIGNSCFRVKGFMIMHPLNNVHCFAFLMPFI